jgi:hypothetical protein
MVPVESEGIPWCRTHDAMYGFTVFGDDSLCVHALFADEEPLRECDRIQAAIVRLDDE